MIIKKVHSKKKLQVRDSIVFLSIFALETQKCLPLL